MSFAVIDSVYCITFGISKREDFGAKVSRVTETGRRWSCLRHRSWVGCLGGNCGVSCNFFPVCVPYVVCNDVLFAT
jgi:hypothetical protein